MARTAFAFSVGVITGALVLGGPGTPLWAALVLALAPFAGRAAVLRAALFFCLGAGCFEAAMQGYIRQREALLADPGPKFVSGWVEGLPECGERGCKFLLRRSDGAGMQVFWPSPGNPPRAGQQLNLRLRLEPPWALRNPGTFDRETWAMTARVHAYARVIAASETAAPAAPADGLDNARERLGNVLAGKLHGARAAPLIVALAIGDRRGIDTGHWRILQRTGTAHLLAISGLHIGLIAALGFVVARFLHRFLAGGWLARQDLAAVAGMAAAAAYAALAGFSLPTVRALLMLAVPMGALLLRRQVTAPAALGIALTVVLLCDPFAPLTRGFWLSFGAVSLLLWVSRGYPHRAGWRRMFIPQWGIFVGLVPLLAAAGLPVSLLAPGVNIIAIPWVSLLVLPLLFAGIVALCLAPPLAEPLLRAAAGSLDILWRGLEAAAAIPAIEMHFSAPASAICLALAGAVAALAPRGCPGKMLALILFAPLFLPPRLLPGAQQVFVHVLDVGQGAANVIQTTRRTLVYDSGPGWDGGWNAGSAVLQPFLRRRGIEALDRIVISHTDMDHAGGLTGLESLTSSAELLGSSPDGRWAPCLAGDRWRWSAVEFRILHPGPWLPYLGNDSSCVLLIQAGAGRYLLTGDIGTSVERRLQGVLSPVGAMSVPHHGSKSSSSFALLDAARPEFGVISVGQGNRFAMPHEETRRRYADRGITLLSTAECGYLTIQLGPGPRPRVLHAERIAWGRPWHQPGLCRVAQTKH